MSKEIIYKQGDTVRVISLQDEDNRGNCHIEVGDIGKIVSVYEDTFLPYFVSFDDGSAWYLGEENLQLMVEDNTKINQNQQTGSITSDGGSSSYYFTKLPKHLIDQIVETGGIEIKDIIRYVFDNDADAFNIVKAQKRIIESNKGKGKSGVTGLYDAKKITFFANEQYEAMKNKESK